MEEDQGYSWGKLLTGAAVVAGVAYAAITLDFSQLGESAETGKEVLTEQAGKLTAQASDVADQAEKIATQTFADATELLTKMTTYSAETFQSSVSMLADATNLGMPADADYTKLETFKEFLEKSGDKLSTEGQALLTKVEAGITNGVTDTQELYTAAKPEVEAFFTEMQTKAQDLAPAAQTAGEKIGAAVDGATEFVADHQVASGTTAGVVGGSWAHKILTERNGGQDLSLA